MALSTKVSGTWKEVNGVYTRVGGSWKTVSNIHTRVNGVWKEVYALTGGNDAYTVLLIHADGADASTVFTDSSSSGHQVNTRGTAQVDTAQSKFGGASALLDGNSDYLSCDAHADWGFGADPFTFDMWVRMNALPAIGGVHMLVCQFEDAANYFRFYLYNVEGTYRLYLDNKVGDVIKGSVYGTFTSLSVNTWYHLACVRSGSTIYMFQDGEALSVTTNTSFGSNNAGNGNWPIRFGTMAGDTAFFNGWIDELRISKGIARWTADFTPPTAAYS